MSRDKREDEEKEEEEDAEEVEGGRGPWEKRARVGGRRRSRHNPLPNRHH